MKCKCGGSLKIKSELVKVYDQNSYDPDGEFVKKYYGCCKKCGNSSCYYDTKSAAVNALSQRKMLLKKMRE
jgi:hypothetical protein